MQGAVGPSVPLPYVLRSYQAARSPFTHDVYDVLSPVSRAGCHHQGTANLVLEGKDKKVSMTGQEEAHWGDVITFRGDVITYRFVAEADGKADAANSLATSDPQEDDWGFRFTVSERFLLV